MDETNGGATTQNTSGVSSVPRSNSRRKGNKANSEAGTGKLCDVKMSCTVWEGGDEKGLNLQHLVSALLHSERGCRMIPTRDNRSLLYRFKSGDRYDSFTYPQDG